MSTKGSGHMRIIEVLYLRTREKRLKLERQSRILYSVVAVWLLGILSTIIPEVKLRHHNGFVWL